MNGITNIVILPYRSNSIIVINNNIGTGGATSPYTYKLYIQKYGLDGVLTPITPLLVDSACTPIDDDVKYGTSTTTINGIVNPYDSTSSILITSKLGREVIPTMGDGVYKLTIKNDAEGEIYVIFTILTNILNCRKNFYDKILKHESIDCNCHPKTFDEYMANYIEFTNLWNTIQSYSSYLQTFMPAYTLLHPVTFMDDIRNIYNLINRADSYCVMCDNKCITCK